MADFYYGRKIKIDSRLKDAIVNEFAGQSVRYHYEVMNEVWLTAAKLSEQIQFFSKSWLQDYGHLLPREHLVYVDEEGVEHKSGWCYPLHRIQRMIHENKLYFHVDSLKGEKKDETP
ncbi:MAG: hypothetical protein IKU02_10100 [Bacteroidaceae bacterium]|nr:hypothetical protein [Bacteroidaceae bacterium]